MAMNRETKRMLQRQGALGADGTPTRERRAPTTPRPQQPEERRTSFRQFLREVRGELRKVAWPTRAEVINYSTIVLVTLVILTALIALLDYAFGNFVIALFNE